VPSCNDDLGSIGELPPGVTPTKKRVIEVPRNRVSAVVGHAASRLIFDGKTYVDIERRAAVATYERRLATKWNLQFAAGGIITGTLAVGNQRHTFGPGWTAGVSTSYRALDGSGSRPFLLFGATLAFAGATTREENKSDAPSVSYLAGDFRLSAVLGKTFFQALSPYLVVRGFGGPIAWQINGKDARGTDTYKFQVGAGLSVSMPRRLDAFLEFVPLGEKALSTGLGYSF
jgi:hypothetical protein